MTRYIRRNEALTNLHESISDSKAAGIIVNAEERKTHDHAKFTLFLDINRRSEMPLTSNLIPTKFVLCFRVVH